MATEIITGTHFRIAIPSEAVYSCGITMQILLRIRLRGQPAQNNIRGHTFFCFTEVWEHALYVIDEKTDSTARYRLLVKYKGMFIRDTDEPYDDYRKVVDLEWSKGRVKDYGNKRGWVLVCELIPPYHDAERFT